MNLTNEFIHKIEQHTLAMLVEDSTLNETFRLQNYHFTDEEHKNFFQGLSNIESQTDIYNINPSLLVDLLEAKDEYFLTQENYRHNCRILHEHYMGLEIEKFMKENQGAGIELKERLEEKCADLWEIGLKLDSMHEFKTVRQEFVEDDLPFLEQPHEEGLKLTQFPGMNVSGGFVGGNIVALVGQLGSGKSFVAQTAAIDFAKQGAPCLYISYEQNKRELRFRTLQLRTGIDPNILKESNKLTPQELAKISRDYIAPFANPKNEIPLYLEFSTGNELELASLIRQYKKRAGIKAVFIDYLNLIDIANKNKNDNREREISYLSRFFKKLALGEDLVLFIVTQFNRQGLKSGSISDISDSIALLKDADYVYSLVNPYEMKNTETEIEGVTFPAIPEERLVKLEKNRNGVAGRKLMLFWTNNMLYERDLVHNNMQKDPF